LFLRVILGIAHVIGVDVDPSKAEFARRLGIYNELYTSDVRGFDYPRIFDVVLAIESIHSILDAGLLDRLESLARRGGLVVLALPKPKPIAIAGLIKRGYVTYRYLLRGFPLVRVDRAEVYTYPPTRLRRVVGLLVMLLHPVLRFAGLLRRGYILAVKVV